MSRVRRSVQLPTMGIATYSGFMAGFASNNVVRSTAPPGTFQNAWNFQTRTGIFNGTFDNQAYSGPIRPAPGHPAARLSTALSTAASRSGTLNGAFFSSPTDAAAYQAGNFSIRGSGYRAGGVFAGQR